MNAPLFDSALAVTLPCVIFVLSIWHIHDQGSRIRAGSGTDVILTGIYVLVNVISCFWASTLLSALWATGGIPVALAQHTQDAGFGLFAALFLVLKTKSIWAGLIQCSFHLERGLSLTWQATVKHLRRAKR
jgi:hypothetical protein